MKRKLIWNSQSTLTGLSRSWSSSGVLPRRGWCFSTNKCMLVNLRLGRGRSSEVTVMALTWRPFSERQRGGRTLLTVRSPVGYCSLTGCRRVSLSDSLYQKFSSHSHSGESWEAVFCFRERGAHLLLPLQALSRVLTHTRPQWGTENGLPFWLEAEVWAPWAQFTFWLLVKDLPLGGFYQGFDSRALQCRSAFRGKWRILGSYRFYMPNLCMWFHSFAVPLHETTQLLC